MNVAKGLKDTWKKYSYILTKTQKKWGVILFIMTIIGAFFEALGVTVILPLVQAMINPEALYKYEIIEKISSIINIRSEIGLIWLIGIGVIGVYLFKNIYLFILSYVRVKYACKIQRELSIEMMQDYMKRGYLFFLNTTIGELLRGMQGSISNVYEGLYQSFKLLAEILTIFCICVYIMISDWMMAVCVVGLSIVCLLLVVFGFKKWTEKAGKIVYTFDALINKTLLQAFQGIKEVLVMGREKYFVNVYRDQYIHRQKGTIWKTVAMEGPTYIIEGICVIGFILMVCVKVMGTEDTTSLVPQLAAYAVAAFRILPSLGRISSCCNTFITCIPGINETYQNFYIVRENRKKENVCDNIMGEREYLNKNNWKFLEIKDVVWKYPEGNKVILDKVSLKIENGTSIAFVGPSGAGKTTFADVILGLLNPQEGRICLDQTDIHDIKSVWGKLVGFVPQSIYLLDDTVRNNIAFGIREEEIDDRKVLKALEQAQLKDFVNSLPRGIETQIGERGTRLSGGQCQRIAIARALYNDPDILVLDEATSALDTETETVVMEAINSLHGQKTLIIIAHRLTTIRNCDAIYRIDEGKAVKCEYEELVFAEGKTRN